MAMSNLFVFTLPYPPSMNTYWRNYRGKMVLSETGRNYAKSVKQIAPCLKLDSRLKVKIAAYAPDKRKRDIDNILKAALDSMTKAGVWLDDEQVDDLQVIRMPIEKPGRIVINISEIV